MADGDKIPWQPEQILQQELLEMKKWGKCKYKVKPLKKKEKVTKNWYNYITFFSNTYSDLK